MVTEKPIGARWRKSARTQPLFVAAIASVISFVTIVEMFLEWINDPGRENSVIALIMIAIYLCAIWSIVIYLLRKENSYKTSVKIIDATPGLEHKLNLAYKKAYETQTVEYGVATEDGLICGNGFAPWESITRITFKSREDHGSKASSPCHMDVEVKLNEKTSYSLSETFSQIRDVSEEIEQQIERIHKFDKSILIINNYIFIG